MSITAEDIARREMNLLDHPDKISVTINLSCRGGNLYLPSKSGKINETATFKIWTFGDNKIIEDACKYKVEREDGKEIDEVDINEVRRLMIKRNLLNWTLPIEIERNNGWMTYESYQRVSRVHAPIIEAFLYEFEKSFIINEDEEKEISKQCAILFSPNSKGVSNACDAISMFCTYGNFSEKFGINPEDLPNMPFKEYQLLRMVMNKEGNAVRRNSSTKDHHSNTRIAAGGVKPRASRGTKIAL